MTKSDLETMRAVVEKWSPKKSREFIRSVSGPVSRELIGAEYEHALVLLMLSEPTKEFNNQHTLTEVYEIGNAVYHLINFQDGKPRIELFEGEQNE